MVPYCNWIKCVLQCSNAERSKEFAKKLGHNDAKQQMVRACSMDSADAVITEHWKYTKLPNLLQKFLADNICTASETGLFHLATLVSSLSYKHVIL
jgi:hypothetical protein